MCLPTIIHTILHPISRARLDFYGRSAHLLVTQDTGSRSRAGVRSTRKDRPTFVLLHGLAGSTASWDEVNKQHYYTVKLPRRRL